MFRRLRYRKWLVAGLGVAALVVPTTALAGNNLGSQDGWYNQAVALTNQAQSQVLDGRSPDTRDAALAPQPTLDPAIVKYLERYGYSQSQIAAMSGGAYQASAPASLDPAIVKYLERYGYSQNQIAAMSGGLYKATQNAQSTVIDGRSPDTIDFASQAHEPVVTVVRDPGFQWGDFGIGLGAALATLMLLGLSMRFLSNRQDRGQQRPVTSS
jgi:hypothetical protein